MKVIAMIPARFEASRFPGKLLKDLAGKPVIIRTYEATKNTNLFDDVYVITDSEVIKKAVEENGGKVFMSLTEHDCGSDRIAEAAKEIDADIVVNVQGDEPFTRKEPLADLIDVFKKDVDSKIDLASLVHPMTNWEDIENPNNVKVVMDKDNHVMYFSRSPIPYPRDKTIVTTYFKHIGIYAFRKSALIEFTKMPMQQNEATEKLEGIRFLEYGKKIKMVETPYQVIGIDTPSDLDLANDLWK
ncbi:3-deoxy-manno-octulosonate cytidylyltransferase [Flavicella sediminum]|uniref:3-deoxy-manno-octulosonate cytidylyltransferase n=1 Tax=Flavicella sediminum TaxID=2585141 RepID=UPI0011210000|nr:3-deoxy-manno-octulosonate cytidylyltransferase [Flavicella sediminum]